MQGQDISKAQLKQQYGSMMGCYESSYFKLYENLRKIQWFVIMLKNLEEKYSDEFQGLSSARRSFPYQQ